MLDKSNACRGENFRKSPAPEPFTKLYRNQNKVWRSVIQPTLVTFSCQRGCHPCTPRRIGFGRKKKPEQHITAIKERQTSPNQAQPVCMVAATLPRAGEHLRIRNETSDSARSGQNPRRDHQRFCQTVTER